MKPRFTTERSEHGGATVELTLIAPLLLLLLLFVVALGRIALAREEVQGAARDAARQASMQRSPTAAASSAEATARQSLETGKVSCRQSDVVADTSSFRSGGWVAVDVTCHADLNSLSLLRIPSSKAIHARFVEPIDTYRGSA